LQAKGFKNTDFPDHIVDFPQPLSSVVVSTFSPQIPMPNAMEMGAMEGPDTMKKGIVAKKNAVLDAADKTDDAMRDDVAAKIEGLDI
jgi:hypothetical protein